MRWDLAVVGAGIVGLAHALAAARLGLKVVVLDRDDRANGASIRNFGLVMVSGEEPGRQRMLAARSRDIWEEVARAAGIPILHRGLLAVAQRREAAALLEAFAAGEAGEGCSLLTRAQLAAAQPGLALGNIEAGLISRRELRVESREALPRLAEFLQERFGVEFRYGQAVRAVAAPRVETAAATIEASRIVICPGDDLAALYPELIAGHGVVRCRLQMLRVMAGDLRLGSAVVSDLSLVRYGGFSCLPEAAALRARLEVECGAALEHGVHLIAVQSGDGSLVVGDSHHYERTPHPFASQEVDRLILDEFARVFAVPVSAVTERWTGTYASSPQGPHFREAPEDDVRLVMITSGTGASTAFAIGEETVADLFGA